jgi:hypothetical protein
MKYNLTYEQFTTINNLMQDAASIMFQIDSGGIFDDMRKKLLHWVDVSGVEIDYTNRETVG